jgi:hypothetical protein
MKNELKQHIEKKIRIQLRILATIFFIMLGFVVYDLTINFRLLPYALIFLTLGHLLGRFFFHRINKFVWDETALKLVTQLDWFGFTILLLYIVFLFTKSWILKHWMIGDTLKVVSLSLSAGIIEGRLISTIKRVRDVFKLIQGKEPNIESKT